MLNRKDQEFAWGPKQQEAFQSINDKLCTAPVLAYRNSVALHTDHLCLTNRARCHFIQASGWNRKTTRLCEQQKTYTIYELKILALVWAIRHFRFYLHYHKFLDRAHHAALTYVRKFADTNSRPLSFSIKLSELDFMLERMDRIENESS